ncbi:hypothetical protein [Sphingobacterium faecium]|uniref:hypothetical protein n=1 Tax=Sphingobacterium faecium TaxID=34087 RepID=UPI00320B8B05
MQEQQGLKIYQGSDFGNIYNENITLGLDDDYIVKSIRTKYFQFETDTTFTEKCIKIKIDNLKYFKNY